MSTRSLRGSFALVALLAASAPAQALRFDVDWGPGFDINWKNKVVLGAQMRMSEPRTNFIGKSNLDPDLCAPDACISLRRDDLEPHQRWMAAPGAAWQISDDANLTHDRFDISSGLARLRSDLLLTGGDGSWGIDFGFFTFFDQVHSNQKEERPNILVEEGPAPGVPRQFTVPGSSKNQHGRDFEIRQANLFFRLPLFGDRELDVRIGRQFLTWGESLFTISGSLNFVNPLNFNNFFRPGMDLDEILDPVNMVTLRTALTDNLDFEAFYQLEWRPYQLPARGSLGSSIIDLSNAAENDGTLRDDSIPLPFGKSPEDPLQLQREVSPVIALISDTALSLRRGDNREPGSSGQFGVKLSYFSELLGDTQFSFYYSRTHARLPAASFTASDATCAAAEGSATGEDAQPAPFPFGLLNFMQACGFPVTDVANLVEQLGNALTGEQVKLVGEGFDALPLSTAGVFVEYPEDIDVFGVGFNTTAFGVALTGELAFRPNQPMQVDLEDLFFAALQPLFPRQELELVPAQIDPLSPVLGLLAPATGVPLDQLAGATFTDRRNALPDFVTAFRGGTPGEVAPGSSIRGFEEFKYLQGALGGTWLFGRERSYLWSDQMVLLLEASFTFVPGMPELDELQLDGLATTNTHFSDGIEESGDALKLNPFATRDGFPTRFAWGYKAGLLWSYNDVITNGLTIRPQLIAFHDVNGITPGLGGNFQEGRVIGLAGMSFDFRRRWNFSFDYFAFIGGGDGNRFRDRDMLNVSVSYRF